MTKRIYFEKYLFEYDFSYYWNLVSNEKAMAMNYGRVFTMEEARCLFNHILKTNQRHDDFGYFKVFETTTNAFIGLGAIIINDSFTEAEIEYLILPDYWSNGYGSEVAEELLHKADKIKSIQKIIAITNPNNVASQKILLRYGFLSQMIYEIDDGSLAEKFIKIV